MLDTQALVIDDDPDMVEVLGRGLRTTVRHVDQETSCRRAIELFGAHKHAVVVLDLVMPEMSGLEVMRRIHLVEPRTQVIIVTGHATAENAIAALNLHAFGFLVKPLLLDQLRRVVADAFAYYQRGAGLGAHEAAIESLYQEVASRALELDRSPGDRALRDAYDESWDRLRRAQTAEAELAARAFRDNLALKKGMGYSSIEAARRVIDRGKDPA